MEDNQFVIIKNSQYFKIEPLIIQYDKKSKRVKSSDNSKTRRFIKAFYLSKEEEQKSILFEISDVKIHKLVPLNEEEGYIDIILNENLDSDNDVFRFFAKFDQYNVEEANKNKEFWFGNSNLENININYLEEIYKPCLKIDSKGRIIFRSSVYLRDFSPDFEIIDENDEFIEFKDIIDKKVEIIFENKGLIFSSKSYTPLFFINTIKLLQEDNNEDIENEISFCRQSIKLKEQFYFNDEISLEKNIKKEIETKEELSVDSQLEEFLDSLENNEKWLKEIKNQEEINNQLKKEFIDVGSKEIIKKRNSKKIKIIKKKKSEKQILN